MDAATLVNHFDLVPHPEGGFYRETYRSAAMLPASLPGSGINGPRNVSTAILFLLRAGEYSHLHRIRQDEIWHFHLGGALRLALISPAGEASEVRIGPDVLAGEQVQFTVPGGFWFGATPAPGVPFTLVGCTVAPGFEFADFELGQRDELLCRFPSAGACVREFTLASQA